MMSQIRVSALLLAFAQPVLCQNESGQHTLRYDIEPGLTYAFEQTISMQMDLEMNSGWQQMQMDQASDQVARGSIEVLEVADGVTTVARVTFDHTSGTTMTSSAMPQPQGARFELAGRTIIATVQADGSLRIADEGGDMLPNLMPDTTQLVRSIAIPDPAFPPAGPIGVGDSWTAMLGSPNEPIRPEYTFTLRSVDGGAATVHAQGRVSSEAEGISFAADLTGEVVIDLATGLPVSSVLSGPMTSSGESDMGGVTTTIEGEGTITQKTAITFDDGASPRAPKATSTEPVTDNDGWSTYSHAPSGLAFRHPADWRIESTAQGLQIIPAGFDADRELLFGFGAPAQGETDPASPAAQQNLDMVMRAQAPTFARQGAPERIEVDEGSAASYRYAGQMPDGRRGICTMHVRIIGGNAVAMGILADEERTTERLPVLRGMFESVREDSGENAGPAPEGEADTDDRRLIGMFQGEVLNNSVEGMYINTQLVYAIGADGRVYFGAQSAMSAHKRDYNQELVWTAHGENAGDVRSGAWSAKDGFLTVKWDDGTRSVFAYGFEPDGALVLRNPQTRELINFFPRIR